MSPYHILHKAIIRHKEALDIMDAEGFDQAVELLAIRIMARGKIIICGNGGSAADAQHLAAEFVVRYKSDRKPIPAIALTTDTSILTAAYNDGYQVFGRQVDALGRPGDVLIAISTSGSSQNVIQAIYAAKNRGIAVIGLTGQHGFRDTYQGIDKPVEVDVELRVPSGTTSVIQEMHMLLYHSLVESLEQELNLCEGAKCQI